MKVERYEKLPLILLPHFLWCRKCRGNVRLMTYATHFSSSRMYQKVQKTDTLYLKTMNSIFQAENFTMTTTQIQRQKEFCKSGCFAFLTLSSWCIIGMLSLFAYIFLPSTKAGTFIMNGFGHYFSLQFFIILGGFFTAYTIIFIARNIELLSKTFRLAK